MNTYFVTGISIDVAKTIIAAIVTEALQVDYWKPIQAGNLDIAIPIRSSDSYQAMAPEICNSAYMKFEFNSQETETVLKGVLNVLFINVLLVFLKCTTTVLCMILLRSLSLKDSK